MSHYQEIADLRLDVAGPSQFDRMQDAARRQTAAVDLPPPDKLATQIAAHAKRIGDARAAYEYLDTLTAAVGAALKGT